MRSSMLINYLEDRKILHEPIRVKRDRASLGKPNVSIVVERCSLVNLSNSLYIEKGT